MFCKLKNVPIYITKCKHSYNSTNSIQSMKDQFWRWWEKNYQREIIENTVILNIWKSWKKLNNKLIVKNNHMQINNKINKEYQNNKYNKYNSYRITKITNITNNNRMIRKINPIILMNFRNYWKMRKNNKKTNVRMCTNNGK
jgi:hypothetical protein